MPCSEYACPVGLCRNLVDDPLTPCGDCMASFGGLLRPSGRDVSDEEVTAQQARAEVKAAALAPVAPISRPPRLTRRELAELAEEAGHLVWWCGLSHEEAATRLGVSVRVLDAAIRRADQAAAA